MCLTIRSLMITHKHFIIVIFFCCLLLLMMQDGLSGYTGGRDHGHRSSPDRKRMRTEVSIGDGVMAIFVSTGL